MKNLLTATFFMIAIHFNAIQAIADMNEKAYNNREGKMGLGSSVSEIKTK